MPDARAIISRARERVLERLRALVEHGQMAFVHAALYQRRLVRALAKDGSKTWCMQLTVDTCLSDQVLGLFAADAMESPDDYAHRFGVCRICDEVHFEASVDVLRIGCQNHPLGRATHTPGKQGKETVPEMAAVRARQRK